MYRVLTIAREFGSGGGSIARLLAERLKWKLLDRSLLEEIARCARVDPHLAERFDECVDPWFHRLGKQALWHGAIEGVATVAEADIFDSEAMTRLAGLLIRDAAEAGDCVIVGRGAQCVLHNRQDAFHTFVHATMADKIRRVRERVAEGCDPAALIRETERKRAAYIRQYFEQDWHDPHLYHLMIDSRVGDQAVARAILCASGLAE